MKKKSVLLFSITLLLALAAFANLTFSWLADEEPAGSAGLQTAIVKTELDFALNTNYGIPGETIAITKSDAGGSHQNTLVTNSGTVDYIFRLSYTVSYPADEPKPPYITGLLLSGADKTGLILEKGYDDTGRQLIYYGRHNMAAGDLDLGELHADFAIMKKSEMNKPFTIDAKVEACQATEAAVFDLWGINSTVDNGKYKSLFSSP